MSLFLVKIQECHPAYLRETLRSSLSVYMKHAAVSLRITKHTCPALDHLDHVGLKRSLPFGSKYVPQTVATGITQMVVVIQRPARSWFCLPENVLLPRRQPSDDVNSILVDF